LTDRGTWISFKNKRDHMIHVEGDKDLFNQYGVILVNPKRHPGVRADSGQAFIDWILSPEGQAAIASYKLDGQQLFFPNANAAKNDRHSTSRDRSEAADPHADPGGRELNH